MRRFFFLEMKKFIKLEEGKNDEEKRRCGCSKSPRSHWFLFNQCPIVGPEMLRESMENDSREYRYRVSEGHDSPRPTFYVANK